MQAGVLNGDEFRSVMENMPRLVTALTTALGVDIATLREWSSQGKLTFGVITNALESQKEKIDADFKKIPITVGGALTNLQTAATKWLGDADQSSQGTKKLADAINYLATNFNTIIQPLEVFGSKLLEVSEIGMRFGKDVSPIIVKGLENIVATAKSVKTEMDAIDFAFSQKVDKGLEKYKDMAQGKFPLPEPAPGMGFVGPLLPQGREEYFSGRAKAAAKTAEDEKAAIKAQEQAQKVLEATIKQRMETERQAADLFKAQAETRLRALEAERDQMEFNFKLQIESANSVQQKEGIISSLAKAREESLRKEFGIKQDIVTVEGEVLKAAYAGYTEELNRASELGLKEQEIIELKTRKLDVENQVKILNEQSAQQQIDLNAQILNASNEAIKNKESEKKAMADLTNEFVKQSAILDKLQKAKAAGATPEQLKNLNETLQSMPTVEIFSDDQISKAIELHDQTARVKEGIDKLTDSQKAVREEALRTMAVVNSNLEYTKELAKGLTEAFDSVGGAIGGMAVAMAEYGKQQATIAIQKQEEITKAAGDPEKVAKAETDASEKSARAQIKSYGDIAKAAQGFFKKGTVGYQALGTAVKVFRAFEMAQTVMSTVKQIDQMGGVFSAFTDSLSKMSVLSDANTAKEIANAQKGAVAKGTEGAANQGSSGDPYSAFARVAAWVALMAGLGVVIGGGASAAPTMTGKDYAKQQQEAFSATLGSTVLGGAEASNSIQNSLDIIAENSTADLDYSQGLLKAFEELSAAMTGLASAVASSFKVNTGGLNLGKSTKYNFEDPGFGMLDNFLTKAIFGSTKVTRELAGQGIELLGQNLGKIIEKGIIKGTQYADVLVTTKKSAFFGLISSTKQTIETITSNLPKPINDAVVNVFTKIRDTFVKSAELVNMGGAEFMDRLGRTRINLGRIPFTDDAKKNGELLNAAINKQADLLAKKLLPAYKDSQIVGEGYFQTFNRVANALTNGKAKLAQFNIEAISYAQIMNKKGDIEKQVVVQSILASNATSDLKDVMAGLPGTADDAIEAFSNLVQIKSLFASVGQASVNLSNTLITASGGIDKLRTNLETYFDRYFTDTQKLGANTQTLSNKFNALGLTMPSLSATVDKTTGVVTDAKGSYVKFLDALSKDTSAAGQATYAKALALAGEFADAAELSASITEQANQTIRDSYTKTVNQQIAVYKLLAKQDPAAAEEALRLERQLAMLGMDALTKQYTENVNALTDASEALTTSQGSLKTAYDNLLKLRDNFVGLVKGIQTYYNELTGPKSPNISPQDAYKLAKDLFTSTAAGAAQGNAQALADLPDVAKQFLEASQKMFASGPGYQKDFQAVLDGLEAGMEGGNKQIDLMTAQLLVAEEANKNLITLDTTMGTVKGAVVALNTSLADYNTKLATYLEAVAKAKPGEAPTPPTFVAPTVTTPATPTTPTTPTTPIEDPKIQAAKDYSLAIATYIRTRNYTSADTIIKRATDNGHTVVQTAGTKTPVKRNDDTYTVDGYAKGGYATPGMALVGEQGPELINFAQPGQVYTAGQTQSILASNGENQKEQTEVMKAQVMELKALVKVQQTANIELIKELKGLKAEMAVLAKKAKLEASA